MKVKQLAQCPAPCVGANATVFEAVKVMEAANVGAAAVMSGKKLVGVISERDVMLRVVAKGRDPSATKVRSVMTKSVKTVEAESASDEALAVMVANHIRHVIVVNENGAVVGLASARHVYKAQVDTLDDTVRTLASFVGADNHGG